MMSPRQIRRIGVMGFAAAFVLLLLLPFIGEDHFKGATRWLSIAGISMQPSEFLKPGFVAICAWFLAAAQMVGGPSGRLYSFITAMACGYSERV